MGKDRGIRKMEQLAVFDEKIAISPIELRPEITSFDSILIEKLKKQLEGKCCKHGYVVPGSLKLLSRSLGIIEKGHFTADILYYIKAEGKVYNPPEGTQLEGEVIRKNKMGLYVILNDAIRIMIPRDLHIGNESFDKVEIGDRIRIEIKKSRYQINDTHILSIGQYLGKVGQAASALGGVAEQEEVNPADEGEEEREEELEEEGEEELEEEGEEEAAE
jgi:DNA-directed RNA polymerase subunit E'/Rpb7